MQFDRLSTTRAVMRWAMAAFYAAAGIIDWPWQEDLG
jgi:hypothetical protein